MPTAPQAARRHWQSLSPVLMLIDPLMHRARHTISVPSSLVGPMTQFAPAVMACPAAKCGPPDLGDRTLQGDTLSMWVTGQPQTQQAHSHYPGRTKDVLGQAGTDPLESHLRSVSRRLAVPLYHRRPRCQPLSASLGAQPPNCADSGILLPSSRQSSYHRCSCSLDGPRSVLSLL